MDHSLTLFEPQFDPAAVQDAIRRLEQTRFPNAETVEDWQQGIPSVTAKNSSDTGGKTMTGSAFRDSCPSTRTSSPRSPVSAFTASTSGVLTHRPNRYSSPTAGLALCSNF